MDSPTERVRVRRLANRGVYDRETIHEILQEGLVCHVGLVEEGQPFVIPMAYGIDGDTLLLHGSRKSRLMRSLAAGTRACVTVTHLDAIVLARSAFHHSMNYRSVVVLGTARPIEDPVRKLDALRRIVEHLVPRRWEDCRQPSAAELAATLVLEMDTREASAKIRQGPPADEAADRELPYYAGIVPLTLTPGTSVPDPQLAEGIPTPDYVPYIARPTRGTGRGPAGDGTAQS